MSDEEDLLPYLSRLRRDRGARVEPLRWRPAADVYRYGSGWLIKLELAGVAPDEVAVTARGRQLIVRGRRRDGLRTRDYACHAMEIVYSEFERVFDFPADLDRAKLLTHYRDGMLLVTLTMDHEP